VARFRLEPVLKLRQHREDTRKRDLAVALNGENQEKETALRYVRLRQDQIHQMRVRQEDDDGPLDIRALIEHRAHIGLLDREIQGQLRAVAVAERETADRRRSVSEAMVDRKALEVIRDKALTAAQEDLTRREAAELDEASLWIHTVAAPTSGTSDAGRRIAR
jgi:flagellar export protein FliJ